MANGDAIGRRFGLLRKRAKQDVQSGVGEQQEALKRRFASLGATGSGEAIKLQQQTHTKGQEALGRAREGIDIAEAGQRQQAEEILKQRAFQTSEREAGQAFGAAQAKLGRDFARGERLGSQEFAEAQRLGGQEFAEAQRIGTQEFAAAESLLGRDQAEKFFDLELDFKKSESDFNKAMASGEIWGLRRQAANLGIPEWLPLNQLRMEIASRSNVKPPVNVGTSKPRQGGIRPVDNRTGEFI